MSTLAEIEAAADALPPEQKRELLLFLAGRLRGTGEMPQPRDFTADQVRQWIEEDEMEMTKVQALMTN